MHAGDRRGHPFLAGTAAPYLAAFRNGLVETGFVEGHNVANSSAAFSIASSAKPNQRITTDSALHPFVTHFFTRLPWRHPARALRERGCAGRLA
jgi:hypothetical protein